MKSGEAYFSGACSQMHFYGIYKIDMIYMMRVAPFRVRHHGWLPHSGSFGLLKSALSLMLPCPNCGKLKALRLPGSSVDAVSSGGKMTSELRNAMTRICCSDDMFA